MDNPLSYCMTNDVSTAIQHTRNRRLHNYNSPSFRKIYERFRVFVRSRVRVFDHCSLYLHIINKYAGQSNDAPTTYIAFTMVVVITTHASQERII